MSEQTVVRSEATDPAAAGIPQKVLNRSFWRYFWSFQISWNYERMQALGFLWAMIPVLRHLNSDDEKFAEGMQRHLTFFNTSVIVGGPLILGTSIALEEGGSASSVEGMKAAMMGPLAGIGDTVTFALYNSIIFTLGASWALEGHVWGTIFAALLVLVPYYLVRRWQFNFGYKQGRNLVSRLATGALDKVNEFFVVLGLIVFGGFIPSIVKIFASAKLAIHEQAPAVLGKAAKPTTEYIQADLNSVLPFLLPVLVTGFIYFLLRKFNLNPLWAIAIIFALGLLLGGFDLFGKVDPTAAS
jgi:mannose/fructose/N-acetylgalactosamine-specific phosphotransferase system component IID